MKRILLTLIMLITAISYFTDGSARQDAKKKISLRKPDIVDLVFVNYNNWSYVMRNNGSFMYDTPDKDQNGNHAGGIFPRVSGITVVYAAGFYIGALKDGIPVVSETEFATEFQPGRIVNSNVPFGQLKAEDPLLPSQKVYLIDKENRTDWPEEALRDQFGNPALIADAQTWAVFNDLDVILNHESEQESPTPGLGIEVTMESYAFSAPLTGDVVFIRCILANKTNTNYTQTYFGAWMDADVGSNMGNDVVGTDTVRSLQYVYNEDNETPDDRAVGFDFLQGPVVHTAQIPVRDHLRNQNKKSVLVYDEKLNQFVSNTLPDNQIVLGAVSSTAYIGSTDPIDNSERYYLMRGANKWDGSMKSGCGENDYFVYRNGPFNSSPCDMWNFPTDQRILLSTGPFTIKAGESQEIWVGVIGAVGSDRLDAVVNLWATDDFAQNFFEQGFPAPSAPPRPNLSVSSLDGMTILTWQNNAESFRDLAGEMLGISTANGYSVDYVKDDFQGYRVYRSLTGLDGSFELLAQYDKVDGLGIVSNRFVNTNNNLEIVEVDLGANTGLQYHYIDSNLINGQNYFYSVTSYDGQPYIAGPDSIYFDNIRIPKPSGLPVSLESSILGNAVSAVPAKPVLSLRYDASMDSSRATHIQGRSDGYVTLEIVDPSKVRSLDYTIEFFTIPADSQGGTLAGAEFFPENLIAYRFVAEDSVQRIDSRSDDPRTFYDNNANGTYESGTDMALDETLFGTAQAVFNEPSTEQPLIIHGIKVEVFGPAPGIKKFLCTANGSGTLAKPDIATFAFNASGFPTLDGLEAGHAVTFVTLDDGLNDRPNIPNLLAVPGAASAANGGKWGFAAGVDTVNPYLFDFHYSNFLAHVMRNDNFTRFVPFDFEIRFTVSGGMANFALTTGNQAAVPFELWNVGINSHDDASDDYRMYPFIMDKGGDIDVWDYTGFDHPISGGDNDPSTDWIYWMNPADMSPGQSGYNAAVAASGNSALDGEVMAQMALVNFNAGNVSDTTFPANVNQLRPANGTIFRIISTKPNATDDVFTFSTTANSVIAGKKNLKRALKDIKVVPNPFYKYSSFETSFDKMIKFTHLPEVCTIKIFTVAGDLIKTIKHNSTSNNDRVNSNPYDEDFIPAEDVTSIERWDLKTANGRYVANGMYIALVESPAGKRFVKFAVIQ